MGRLNPVFVEVTRGDMVESRHRGAAAVVDADGSVVHAWGDVEGPVFSRSAIKPLQALPLVETGAAGRFAVSDVEIALACGSHGGAPEHVRPVAAWLERIGLAPGDLECGTHPPTDQEAAGALVRAGEDPSPLHNNCSGKHAGFLTTAVHLGEATAGYVRPDHPVQKRIERVLADLGGVALEGAARGTDGCGIPVIAMPLTAIARAMARLADPRGLAPPRAALAAACDARLRAMVENGALEEVRGLRALGLDPRLPVMKALGVRELVRHLDGALSLDDAIAQAQQATSNYAKRQMTWLRTQTAPDGPRAVILNEQYSKSLDPKIFAIIRRFLLTG